MLTTPYLVCVLVTQFYAQHHTFMYFVTLKLYGLYTVNIYSPCAFDPSSWAVRALDMTDTLDDTPSCTPFYTTNRG